MRINLALRILLTIMFCSALLLISSTSFCFAQEARVINGQGAVFSGSSFCDEYEDIQFNPGQAFNGNPDRPWMAAAKFNPKNEEWVKAVFTKPVSLAALRISPGFGHKPDLFYKYSRLKKFEIILDQGNKVQKRTYERHFDSDAAKDMILIYSTQPEVKSITLKVLEIYPGTEGSNALIGNIEPILVQKGRIQSELSSIAGILEFLKTTGSPTVAFNYLPSDEPLLLKKSFRHANPLDSELKKKISKKYTRDNLKKEWGTWKDLCQQIFSDFRFNSYESVSYFWKDPSGNCVLDMVASDTADVMNSYTFNFTQQSVTETVKKKDSKTKKTAEEKITVSKAVINSISMVQDIYTP